MKPVLAVALAVIALAAGCFSHGGAAHATPTGMLYNFDRAAHEAYYAQSYEGNADQGGARITDMRVFLVTNEAWWGTIESAARNGSRVVVFFDDAPTMEKQADGEPYDGVLRSVEFV